MRFDSSFSSLNSNQNPFLFNNSIPWQLSYQDLTPSTAIFVFYAARYITVRFIFMQGDHKTAQETIKRHLLYDTTVDSWFTTTKSSSQAKLGKRFHTPINLITPVKWAIQLQQSFLVASTSY